MAAILHGPVGTARARRGPIAATVTSPVSCAGTPVAVPAAASPALADAGVVVSSVLVLRARRSGLSGFS